MSRATFAIPFVLLSCLIPLGCATPTERNVAMVQGASPTSVEVNVPPKQLVETIKSVMAGAPLSLPVEKEERGLLVTGWQRFPGEWHIARRWQERTRYIVRVVPDWDDPAGKSRLEVTAQTEQRAAEGQNWTPAPELARQDRAERVLEQIRSSIRTNGR